MGAHFVSMRKIQGDEIDEGQLSTPFQEGSAITQVDEDENPIGRDVQDEDRDSGGRPGMNPAPPWNRSSVDQVSETQQTKMSATTSDSQPQGLPSLPWHDNCCSSHCGKYRSEANPDHKKSQH